MSDNCSLSTSCCRSSVLLRSVGGFNTGENAYHRGNGAPALRECKPLQSRDMPPRSRI